MQVLETMGIRDIKTEPNPILRKKTDKIPSKKIRSKAIQELIVDMIDTMKYAKGVGIAAPQVGESKRIIVFQHNGQPLALVNPKILSKSWKKVITEEGCLSIPGIFGRCKRSKKIRVLGRNITGAKVIMQCDGLESIIIQHEIDHLNGILFTDRMKEQVEPPKEL